MLSNSLHLECRPNLVTCFQQIACRKTNGIWLMRLDLCCPQLPCFLLDSPTLEEASCHLVRILKQPEDDSQQEQDLSYNWILQCQTTFQTVAVPTNILTTCASETLSLPHLNLWLTEFISIKHCGFFFFLLLKIFLFVSLFLAVLSLCCCMGFSLVWESIGAILYCGAQVSHCSGISCCVARALGCTDLSSCSSWALEHRLSSCA